MSANTKKKYDIETKNFETLKYNISDNTDILLGDSCDPDVNFFNKKVLTCLDQFSLLHPNIRSIKKNFENFELFLKLISFTFSVICLFETWWDDLATIKKSLFELPNYNSTHQARGDRKGGGISIYIYS